MLMTLGDIHASQTVVTEPPTWIEDTMGHGIVSCASPSSDHSCMLIETVDKQTFPFMLPPPVAKFKSPTAEGIQFMMFSPTGSHLAVIRASQPCLIWIYDFLLPSDLSSDPSQQENTRKKFDPYLQTLIMCNNLVRDISWSPAHGARLAWCTGSKSLYTWSELHGTEGVGVPHSE